MEMVQTILVIALLVVCLCFSISFLLNSIQNIIYDHRHEKRDIEKDKRDLEYHEKRMNDYK